MPKKLTHRRIKCVYRYYSFESVGVYLVAPCLLFLLAIYPSKQHKPTKIDGWRLQQQMMKKLYEE